MDLLMRMIEEGMSEDEADRLVENVAADPTQPFDLMRSFRLSQAEATAVLHGVPYGVVARWRYDGWPTVCCVCGRELHIDAFGWWHKLVDGEYWLGHVDCLGKLE